MRALGRSQQNVLNMMNTAEPRTTYGYWDDRAGWYYGSMSETNRILESLAKRGLVIKDGVGAMGYGIYRADDLPQRSEPAPKPRPSYEAGDYDAHADPRYR